MVASSTFGVAEPLPKGPHGLTPEQIRESHRLRLMVAMTELMAEKGWARISIADLVSRVRVSRTGFYESFEDKEACLLAAYDVFSRGLAGFVAESFDDQLTWQEQTDASVTAYLERLQGDVDATRAFLLEMDSAGKNARDKRREGTWLFAELIINQHRIASKNDPELVVLSDRVYMGLSLGVRELIKTELKLNEEPDLIGMRSDIVDWIVSVISGSK